MTELNLGRVVGQKGDDGSPGPKGETGADGFSPTISANPGNTADIYKLDITNKSGTFTTPNLKGADGSWTGDAVVMGVKGSNEDTYRNGYVNISPADIGAATMAQVDSAIQAAVLDSWEASY